MPIRAPAPPAPVALCDETAAAEVALREHVRAHHLLDAHGLAQVLLAICPIAPFRDLVGQLPSADLSARALALGDAYDRAWHTRRPWLAGTLSAVVPRAGQAYASSWSGAAVAFVLNAVLIGATVELGVRHLYLSAGASGVAASIFYVGNALNAADLARRRDEETARPSGEALERFLLPEAYP